MKKIGAFLRLMRVRHYIKNLLVFAALGCSGMLFQADRLLAVLAGFAAFCAISSAVYIVNDIRDREKDRLHPVKRNRPIASGEVSVKSATALAVVLVLAAAALSFLAGSPASGLLLGLYFVLNVAYSFGLKDRPLIDVAILASGFLIRVAYGAMVADVVLSGWLYLVVTAMALYLSLGKRRNELARTFQGGETRKVLKYYSLEFLDKNMYMCLALTNVFYALWCMDGVTSSRYGISPMFTVPIVIFITMRYSMDVEANSDGDPVEVLLHDRPLMLLCGAYLAVMVAILYFF